MINLNGSLLSEEEATISVSHRGFRYGDGVFETLLSDGGGIHFWEDHYFRLMAAMRIIRMQIPMEFTPEFLEEEIQKTIDANGLTESVSRVRLQVNRKGAGFYFSETNDVNFSIEVEKLEGEVYSNAKSDLKVDVFKDHLKPVNLLSSVKTCNSLFYIIAANWAKENQLQDALILNDKKQIIESVNSNIFLLLSDGKTLVTPADDSGALKGIMRKKVMEFSKEIGLEVEHKSISPFDLLKVQEIWLTNSVKGVQTATHYKKTVYSSEKADEMNEFLRAQFH